MKGWLFIGIWFGVLFVPTAEGYARKVNVSVKQRVKIESVLERIRLFIEENCLMQGDDVQGKGETAGIDLEATMEYFEELVKLPMKINGATRRELEQLIVLTQFQIESILNYREQNGDILSAAELSLLHGFDDESVELILPFISFDIPDKFSSSPYNKCKFNDFLRDCSSQLYFRGGRELQHNEMFDPITREEFEKYPNSRYLGTPYYLQLKYKFSYNSKVSAGFTLENDIGEPLFQTGGAPVDFFSFNAALHNTGKINTIIIGDYSARFGQGLVLWNSFNLKSSGIPSSLFKRGTCLLPYTSSDENDFFRGCAASFSFGNLDVSAMFSYNRLDARIKDEKYTSIIDGGLHNTISLMETRKRMTEGVGALSLKYRFRRLHIGYNFAAYGYNRANGGKVSEYNRYQMYDGIWGNSSLDFYTVINNLRLFGEFALDFGGSAALLAGSIFPIKDKLECGILLRSYSKSYIAPHAEAYTTIPSVSNQIGVTCDLLYKISNCTKLAFYVEDTYYPWQKYNTNGSSYMLKEGIKLQFDDDFWNGCINASHTHYSHDGLNRIYLKSKFTFSFSSLLRGAFHGAFVSAKGFGYEVGTGWRFRSGNKRFTINFGMSIFNCKEWDNRLYIYENDLPYTYSSRLLYGNGISSFILADYHLFKGVEVYIKNGTQCYFSDNRESQSDLKFAVKLNF